MNKKKEEQHKSHPNYLFKVGDMVRTKAGTVMKVRHVIGEEESKYENLKNMIDEGLKLKDFCDGDVICIWKDKHDLFEKPFKASELSLYSKLK